jgi:hypothetical protein
MNGTLAAAIVDCPDPGFTKVKRQPEAEIFTNFSNVKSRVSWTPERQQLLRDMWDRGEKAPVIAAALVQSRRCQCRPGSLRPEAAPHCIGTSEGTG